MRRGRTFWAQLTLSTQRALLRLLERKAKDNSNKYNNARVAGVRVGGRQRDPVLSQSRAYQEALVRTGFKEERPRPPSRSAIIPVACSDGPPGTWLWSLCCLRPEDAGTDQGMSKPAGILAADIESTTLCGLDSVLRQMQTDARYCSRGWRVGK